MPPKDAPYFATALAPSLAALMVLRVVAAIVAGTLSPAAFAIAGQRAEPGYAGRAIGTVAAGLTVSLAVGVPIGTWLSTRWGWHAAFVAVGMFTAVALAAVVVTVPRFGPVTKAGIGDRLRALRSPAILACAGTTTIGACAGLMPYTYIAPISDAVTGRPGLLTVFIATIGIAGAIGAAAGGSIADGWGPDRA
ncbi:MFS transporter [Streptomyces antioxidans]|uniref:MFS transporter n=1 Tax=Streptomyces antioxidans TaxID=1507734 RepID=A0A1V4D5X4_9ACTN|nr:MFS transporter [Streptomyces antioxidans]OPF79651.1 MFS transporter [Streptomyces antioxidans]